MTWIPRNLDIQNLPFQDPNTGASVYYRTTITNPILATKKYRFTESSERFIASTNLIYEINDKFNMSYTYGLDSYNEINVDYVNKGGTNSPLGFMQYFNNRSKVKNHRFIFNADRIDIAKDLSFQGRLGAESKSTIYVT